MKGLKFRASENRMRGSYFLEGAIEASAVAIGGTAPVLEAAVADALAPGPGLPLLTVPLSTAAAAPPPPPPPPPSPPETDIALAAVAVAIGEE